MILKGVAGERTHTFLRRVLNRRGGAPRISP